MRSQIVAAAVPFVLLTSAPAQEAPRVSEEARRLHEETFVFDGHVHMINRQRHLGGNIGDRLPDGQVDLPRMKEGGVDAFFMTLFVMEQYYPARYETKQTLRLMNMALDQLEEHGGVVELARDAADIERINRAGKMAAVLDLEGGFDLEVGKERFYRVYTEEGLALRRKRPWRHTSAVHREQR
jgi:membrane dipeptidase